MNRRMERSNIGGTPSLKGMDLGKYWFKVIQLHICYSILILNNNNIGNVLKKLNILCFYIFLEIIFVEIIILN
jgi:hypothetical protein